MSKAWLTVLAAVVLLPVFVRHAIATEIWIFAIFGLGLNLLLGYTGLLSFGQATFFGAAAYVAGYLLKYHAISVWTALVVGVVVGAVTAAAVGYLCVQRAGLYFIMLTFALNQLFYFTAYQWTTVTGGEDGMPGIPRPNVLGVDIHPPLAYYALVAALFLLSLWVMKRLVESPLGKILQAIRENEPRAEALGYDVARLKLAAFVIGGAFSGLAGVLYAMLFGIVPLESIGFVFSGNVVFATLIGGSGSLYGPVIGSFVFIWLSESVSSMWARWPLLLGIAFVIVVLFLRGGVVEAWARFWQWRGLAWRRADSDPALIHRAMEALEEVGLGAKASQPARAISHGEQRQLELAIALAAAPRLLLLDEPAAGLSPDETRKMVALVQKIKRRYTIIL